MIRYVAFDAETGGVTTDTSLLTLYMIAMDENFEVLGDLDLKIKPNNNEPYTVTAEALRINGIDLIEHDKVAITESHAGQEIRKFLWTHSANGKIKLVPIGHNIAFDEDFIHAHGVGKGEYNKYVSYRKLDTASIAQFFKASGKMPNSVTGSLTSLVQHYGLTFTGAAHDAKVDTLATVAVLREMLKQ